MPLTEKTEWVWNARWESFWIYDEEFFNYEKKDYFRKARTLSEAGINAVITFGSFHFRWNFVHEWPRLLEILGWVCEACHEYGIKVVEHHSANLITAPLGEDEWAIAELYSSNSFSVLKSDKKRKPVKRKLKGVALERHPYLFQRLKDGDCIYKGVRLSSMFQTDPRTGQYARSPYYGWVLCHNNPDFHKLYFDHLKEIYSCGVDGIMTDDIGFYPQGYGCGCLHCRDKFRKDCGLEIPPSGLDDKNFYGNFNNPAYRRWILWRINCKKEHEIRVRSHFQSQGLDLARPIYHSSATNSYGTWGFGTSLDSIDGLYSTVFTEVNDSDVQAHSFLRIGAESSQRNALAVRNNVPPMCLFYPKNANESLFCWAVTKTWGQNYWGTSHENSEEHDKVMSKVYNFERLHPEIYEKPVSLAEIGVVFSAKTVILHKDNDAEPRGGMSDPASTDCWAGWCEVLSLANITYNTLLEKDIEENKIPARIKVLIVPNIACMSDKSVNNIKQYVSSGGNLIITHQSGIKNETGDMRETYPFSDIIGADYSGQTVKCSNWKNTGENNFNTPEINHDAIFCDFKLNTAQLNYIAENKYPAVFSNNFGKGKVITFACKPGRLVCINRHKKFEKDEKRYVEINFSMNKDIAKLMIEAVGALYQNPCFIVSNLPEGVLCGFFKTASATVIHLLNASGILQDNGKTLPMPPPVIFPDISDGQKSCKINIRDKCTAVQLFSPENEVATALNNCSSEEGTTIEIPLDLIRSYSVIRIN